MKRYIITLLCAMTLAASAQQPTVEFITPEIVRVRWTTDNEPTDNGTGVCVYERKDVKVKRKETTENCILTSSALTVMIDKTSGAVTFKDKKTGKY